MSKMKVLLISFVVTLGIWLFFSWPLPEFVASGIPSSGQNIEKGSVRTMVEGDTLQLLYHFWLFSDMLAGNTEWFHNPYEFNTGSDDDRMVVDSYYFPFSFIYAVFAYIGGTAFGWNIAGFISLWLTYAATWVLLAGLTRDHMASGVFALVSILIPVRWMNLLGGSPTGFAMMWIPVLMLGLDMAVRRRRLAGGFIAGAALLFACWTDLHVFYFSALLTPVWFFLCLIMPSASEPTAGAEGSDSAWEKLLRIALNLLPMALAALIILGYVRIIKEHLGASIMDGGRSLPEILLFSQSFSGLWSLDRASFSSWLYLGYGFTLVALVASGSFFLRFRSWTTHERRVAVVLFCLLAGAVTIACLAAGPLGPFGGRIFMAARKLVPSYDMIRQPGKVFAIMPTFMALIGGLGFSFAFRRFGPARRRGIFLVVLGLVFFLEYMPRVNATICALNREQGAYRAVAEDALEAGRDPRAVVLVMWPGDSHFASIYQYYASIYRIRLVNGYSPSVSMDYFNNVFKKFESMNQGFIADTQLDALLDMNVDYILLHENLFPEKVSPFPVAFTLKQLLNHPRTDFIGQDGSVWAFKIRKTSRVRPELFPEWNVFFPARRWHANQLISEQGTLVSDPDAVGGEYMRLDRNVSAATGGAYLSEAEGLRWMARVRGEGRALLETVTAAGSVISVAEVELPAGGWVDSPIKGMDGVSQVCLRVTPLDSALDWDMALVTAGEWASPELGESVIISAPCFFHAGYTDFDTGYVCFRKEYDPESIVFYGPKLALAPGVYEFRLHFTSAAQPGVALGAFNFRVIGDEDGGWHNVIAGKPASGMWESNGKPVFLAFRFDRNEDLCIINVEITRKR